MTVCLPHSCLLHCCRADCLPGVTLSWSAGSRCVTLVHTGTGAAISLSPTGHMVYSPNGQPVDALLDSCQDLALQHEQQEEQQQAAALMAHVASAAAEALHTHPNMPGMGLQLILQQQRHAQEQAA